MKWIVIFWSDRSGTIKQEFETKELAELAMNEWLSTLKTVEVQCFAFSFCIRQ